MWILLYIIFTIGPHMWTAVRAEICFCLIPDQSGNFYFSPPLLLRWTLNACVQTFPDLIYKCKGYSKLCIKLKILYASLCLHLYLEWSLTFSLLVRDLLYRQDCASNTVSPKEIMLLHLGILNIFSRITGFPEDWDCKALLIFVSL